MITLEELLRKSKAARAKPGEQDLRSLPYLAAIIYGRASTQRQITDSHESIMEIAKMVAIARKDGYRSNLEPDGVEKWLRSIQNGEDVPRVIEDGEIIIDCRDLGLSGSLGEDKRPGLAELWRRVESGQVGAVYLTEGMSRLSRDRDRVLGYKLLKLLKEHKCRIRTPEGVYNPAIPRDWENLADDVEDSAEEMKKMGVRLGRRRVSKAEEGRHVGSPVSPGYIVEIEGQKRDGSYIMGKWLPYPPHQEVVIEALEELVKQRSRYKAAQALHARGVVFPFFPEELKYMETRSVLRQYVKNEKGYDISAFSLKGMATDFKLLGVWQWLHVQIENNHQGIVPKDLLLQAYKIATSTKLRGRAAYAEPMEWSGLLYCCNHEQPEMVSAHNKRSRWACNHDYKMGLGPRCLYIEDHLLTPPLTRQFLSYLDLTPHAQAVLEKLRAEASEHGVEQSRSRRRETELKSHIANLKRYLGSEDPEKEETYWQLIKEAQAELNLLNERPPAPRVSLVDLETVSHFLENLEDNWVSYPSRLRSHLLTTLVEGVELRHDFSHIEATIIWRTGFRQVVNIKRIAAHNSLRNLWQSQEDDILRLLWPTASHETILSALPGRTRAAINQRASTLKLKRPTPKNTPDTANLWTKEDDKLLGELYLAGTSIPEIAGRLGRSESAIKGRASVIGAKRPKGLYPRRMEVEWEAENMKVMQESTSLHR